MDIVARESSYVTGRTLANGGARLLGPDRLRRVPGHARRRRARLRHADAPWPRVGVEGVGKVGHRLVGRLIEDGAEVVICDVSEQAVEQVRLLHPQVEVVAGRKELTDADIDVYAPCALGGALDDDTVARLRAAIVCGGANNQLAHPGVEKQLADRGILYAPDYVVNSGGVIQVADEIQGFNMDRAKAKATQIYDTTLKIFSSAAKDGVPPAVAADRLAERRMSEVGRIRGIWLGH
ncbi:Glu/Leu/Phe/Val dehydrogenase family protein [Streptosporangium lutulentum]